MTNRRPSRACAALLLAGVLGGCAQTVSGLPRAPRSAMPQAGVAPEIPPYRLQVGDVLGVRLLLNPELNEEVTVSPDGRISTVLAEGVVAYGLTPEQLAAELRRDYGRELRSPRLSVEVRSFAPNRIYVAGEVNVPGEFVTVGPNLSVLQALARAGGVKLSADTDRIFLVRRGPGDVAQVYSVNYRAAIRAADPGADVRLAPFDVVYVPRSGVYEFYTHFNQYLQQFVPVSWGFSYLVSPLVGGR
jgi:polysaccharide export outer membrane protein